MRLFARIIAGLSLGAVVAVGLPAAANASTAPTAASTATMPVTTSWGPVFSSDHRAKAQGTVTVDQKVKKIVFWKKWWTWDNMHHKVWHKKKIVKFVKIDVVTVKSTLWNFAKHFGKFGKFHRFHRFRCAWETFKIVDKWGHVSFRSFYNCGKDPADFSFTKVDVAKVFVDVSRGNARHPQGRHSGFQLIYPVA
jgi:hypothetical protein